VHFNVIRTRAAKTQQLTRQRPQMWSSSPCCAAAAGLQPPYRGSREEVATARGPEAALRSQLRRPGRDPAGAGRSRRRSGRLVGPLCRAAPRRRVSSRPTGARVKGSLPPGTRAHRESCRAPRLAPRARSCGRRARSGPVGEAVRALGPRCAAAAGLQAPYRSSRKGVATTARGPKAALRGRALRLARRASSCARQERSGPVVEACRALGPRCAVAAGLQAAYRARVMWSLPLWLVGPRDLPCASARAPGEPLCAPGSVGAGWGGLQGPWAALRRGGGLPGALQELA
jgi:hypothetical protein